MESHAGAEDFGARFDEIVEQAKRMAARQAEAAALSAEIDRINVRRAEIRKRIDELSAENAAETP